MFGVHILVNIKSLLSVSYHYNETCGERKSNHGEGCMQKCITIWNCGGEVQFVFQPYKIPFSFS